MGHTALTMRKIPFAPLIHLRIGLETEHYMSTMNIPPRPKRKKVVQKNANGEGSIYWSEKRKRWVAQHTFSETKRPTKFFKLKRDANKWLEEQKRMKQMGQSTYTPHAKMKVKDFLESWLAHRNKKPMPPETFRNYKGAIKRITAEIGAENAMQLSPHSIEELLTNMSKTYSESTCSNAYAVLSAAYRYAVKMGDFPINPVLVIPKPDVTTEPRKHIPSSDFKRIYAQASLHPYTHARIELGAIVGARPGEILGLKWSDIHWDEQYILIERQLQRVKDEGLVFRQVKQKVSRKVPVTKTTLQILKTHKSYQELTKKEWEADFDLVFPNTVGKPLDAKRDRKWWLDLLKAAGTPHFTLYQLRKTAFTLMASTGTDMPTVLLYTGHTNSATILNHYAFSIDENMRTALEKLDALRPITTSFDEMAE
jgi:integrase